MKCVNRRLVKSMARVTRKYAKTGDVDILPAKNELARTISSQLLGNDENWLAVCDLFSALCGVAPLKHCTNDEIVAVMKLLEFEVTDDG